MQNFDDMELDAEIVEKKGYACYIMVCPFPPENPPEDLPTEPQ